MASHPELSSQFTYESCLDIIYKYDIQKFHQKKPMLDGNECKNLLNVKGSDIKKFLDIMLRFQAINPNCTKEECANFVKKYHKDDLDQNESVDENDEVFY